MADPDLANIALIESLFKKISGLAQTSLGLEKPDVETARGFIYERSDGYINAAVIEHGERRLQFLFAPQGAFTDAHVLHHVDMVNRPMWKQFSDFTGVVIPEHVDFLNMVRANSEPARGNVVAHADYYPPRGEDGKIDGRTDNYTGRLFVRPCTYTNEAFRDSLTLYVTVKFGEGWQTLASLRKHENSGPIIKDINGLMAHVIDGFYRPLAADPAAWTAFIAGVQGILKEQHLAPYRPPQGAATLRSDANPS